MHRTLAIKLNPESLIHWFEQAAIITGVLVAVAALFVQLSKVVEKFIVIARNRRNRRHTRHLLIYPEPNEIARFSVKTQQDLRSEEVAYQKAIRLEAEYERWRYLHNFANLKTRTQARMITLAIFFWIGFLIIGMRFGYLAGQP